MPADPTSSDDQLPHEISRQTLGQGKFLRLDQIHWRDATGKARQWESAERINVPGTVVIIAWLVPSRRLVLIRQFRPPAGKYVLEFPAGLIDAGETPEQAAMRELHEETGYRARILQTTAPAFNSPGMCSESAHFVMAEIGETAMENMNAKPHFDGGEQIETHLVSRDDLAEFVARAQAAGSAIDSKLACYLAGMEIARR